MAINSKQNCSLDLSASIRRTSSWRRGLQDKYNDPRNGRAADILDRIAAEAEELSDEAWSTLSQHYCWSSGKWADSVSQTSRLAGFRHVDTLSAFVEQLVRILSQASVAA
jgi:hypothetical protein